MNEPAEEARLEAERLVEFERLRETVDHLSRYAKCSRDAADGIAHGGASICQQCAIRYESEIERLRRDRDALAEDVGRVSRIRQEQAVEIERLQRKYDRLKELSAVQHGTIGAQNREIEQLRNDMESAWVLIANAWGGFWGKASEDWKKAAERWRDEAWHRIASNCGMPEESA